jgi:anaerobic magnesium-protoporphyrin IX monomethyl ester cyclase
MATVSTTNQFDSPIQDAIISPMHKETITQTRLSLTGTRKIRVAFCQHFWYEYIGPMALSAQLKKHGHEVECFIYDLSDLFKSVKQGDFDLVCFTIMTSDVKWALDGAAKIKQISSKIPIICGGAHPTYHRGLIEEKNIDMICVGEGDDAIVEVADALGSKKSCAQIHNLVTKDGEGNIITNPLRPMITDLDSLPFPDRQLYRSKFKYFQNSPITSMIATRGCPYKCTFCEIPSYMDMYETNKFYYRSAENIIAEVDSLKEQGIKPNLLLFVDSTFNLNLKWTVDFFQKYKNHINLPFSCNIVAGMINEKLVEALGDTKLCQSIRFAVEVGNEKLRKEVLGKQVSNKKMVWAANALKKKKIPLYVYLMFAVPYDSVEQTLETIHLTQGLKPDFVNSTIFSPYRGLAITEKALEGGYLTEEDINRLDDPEFSRTGSVLRLPEKNTIVNLYNFSLIMIHFPWTEPILKKFIHVQNNFLFKVCFLVSHFLQTRRFVGIGFFRSIYEGYQHRLES